MSKSLGIAKSSNFDLILRDELSEIVFNCQSSNMPGISVGETTYNYFGIADIRPGDSLQFNPFMVNAICDENYEAFFQAVKLIFAYRNPKDGTLNTKIPTFDGTLILTSNKKNPRKLINFKNMWLQDISDLQMETTSDDSFLTFALTFKYTYYEIIEA